MSDYSDFCESYGGDANDPDFMDNWLDKHASGRHPISKKISKNEEQHFIKEYKLTATEWSQVKHYVSIYKTKQLKKHHEVNKYISDNNLWNEFSELRSMNDHGKDKVVRGITEKYFKLICELLDISGDNGAPLIKAEKY